MFHVERSQFIQTIYCDASATQQRPRGPSGFGPLELRSSLGFHGVCRSRGPKPIERAPLLVRPVVWRLRQLKPRRGHRTDSPDAGADNGRFAFCISISPSRPLFWRLMNEVTQMLDAVSRGDAQAVDQLMPLVYEELRRLAAGYLDQERAGQTLQPTALVHEAYLQLVRSEEH